ncbi:hypothetical protein C4D60_Mb07t14710 [Musa balbisiana]|uniref:Uncharacterized protein n=1 Tax=Musa balbisiana TaxID=52838 RepID=A0A4S8JFK1_MUSBA|nr:hypothetical protein C4D60_Mb07t14710 [Musa balbisiana]
MGCAEGCLDTNPSSACGGTPRDDLAGALCGVGGDVVGARNMPYHFSLLRNPNTPPTPPPPPPNRGTPRDPSKWARVVSGS